MNKNIKVMVLCGLLLAPVCTKPFGFGDMVWGGFCFGVGAIAGAAVVSAYGLYELNYDREMQQSYLTYLAKENPKGFAELVLAASIEAGREKIEGK